MTLPQFDVDPALLTYVLAFGTAALVCFASVGRTRRIDDPDTRRGLAALLLASGGWATAHVAFLLAPTNGLKYWLYVAGLVVGFAAVGPWLYFCSAYTGRGLHRNRAVRRAAVLVFLGVVAIKVTNPLHGLYFQAEPVASPFAHLAVDHQLAHWLVMGLSYALATVGYFMLFELFVDVGEGTGPLHGLVALTALPIALDVAGVASPALVDITYEPLGVAAFAVGVLYVYLDRFQSVRLAGTSAGAVIVLSADDRIRDYNGAAGDLFPDLARGAVGEPVWSVLPGIAEALRADEPILEYQREGATRYYHVSGSPVAGGTASTARRLTFDDVTHRERYRRELERQNERLEQFASMVSHDLRNPLNVAVGRIELAREEHDSEHLETAATALDRIGALIEDLLSLARQGQPIDEMEAVSLRDLAERSWRVIDAPGADLSIDGDLDFAADPDRTRQLLENLLRNAIDHGGDEVTIRVGPLDGEAGFYVDDDGPGIPPGEREDVFDSGYSTADNGTGFGLAIVAEIVDAHGWSIVVVEGDAGGARFEISGLSAVPRS